MLHLTGGDSYFNKWPINAVPLSRMTTVDVDTHNKIFDGAQSWEFADEEDTETTAMGEEASPPAHMGVLARARWDPLGDPPKGSPQGSPQIPQGILPGDPPGVSPRGSPQGIPPGDPPSEPPQGPPPRDDGDDCGG